MIFSLQQITVWKKLSRNELVPVRLAQKIYGYMTVKSGHVKRNFSNGTSLKGITEDLINIEELRNDHGLLAAGSWQRVFDKVDDKKKTFIEAMEKNGEDISPTTEPRIKLSTIHGAKGDERQNTVLMLDIDY